MNLNELAARCRRHAKIFYSVFVSGALLLSGCSKVLVQDPIIPVPMNSAYCEGTQWSDDSSVSMVPVPIFAFLFPHTDQYVLKPDDYLQQCAPSTQLVNREVFVDRNACIPAALTRLITLGVWQWCPAYVVWVADIVPQEAKKERTSHSY